MKKKTNKKKPVIVLPQKMEFASDVFKCEKCGYEEYRRALVDVCVAPCPYCGGKMVRK